MFWVRFTYPRLREDQLQAVAWKFLIPIGLANILITGAEAVANEILSRGSRFAPMARPALVNGTAGVVVGPKDSPFAVVGFTVARGRIVAIDLITNQEKLGGIAPHG
jgi:hypothetical protein